MMSRTRHGRQRFGKGPVDGEMMVSKDRFPQIVTFAYRLLLIIHGTGI